MEVVLRCFLSVFLVLPHIINIRSKSIHYRIEPDDPGGPFYVRDKSINDTFIFQFEKFKSNSNYQVILSFPGYLPIECESNVTQDTVYHHQGKELKSGRTGRLLLDTNIKTFKSGNRAIEQTIIKIIVKCQPINKEAFDQMIASGAALKSHRKAGKVDISKYIVQFGIKIESLWFGVIPNSLISLAIACVVIGFVIVLWITPFILRNIKPKNE